MELPKVIASRVSRPVAIFGHGVSGLAVRDLLAKQDRKSVV